MTSDEVRPDLKTKAHRLKVLLAPHGQPEESVTPSTHKYRLHFYHTHTNGNSKSFIGAAKITYQKRWPNSIIISATIVRERYVISIPCHSPIIKPYRRASYK